MGISEPQSFIKRHFPSDKILYLPSCAVGSLLFDQVEASIEDAVSSGTYIDLMVFHCELLKYLFIRHIFQPILPSVLSEQDAAQMIQDVLKKNKQNKAEIMCGSMVVPGQLISALTQAMDPLVQSKAQEVCVS